VSYITCKFGGTSLASTDAIRIAVDIVQSDPNRKYVVPSAPGKRFKDDKKVTDLLYAWHNIAAEGLDPREPRDIIAERFSGLAKDLGASVDIQSHIDEIAANAKTGTSADYMASRGEYLNGLILADILGATFVEPADCIRFNEIGEFDDSSYAVLADRLTGDGLFVIPGFYGATADGNIKTFSRGGSDVTGAIVARATSSVCYENWTDVSGFRMTDPAFVPEAKRVEEITYQELRELAYMGASVLHDESIHPVRKVGIPINIRNTKDQQNPGTRIVGERDSVHPVCGIAGRAGFSMINVEKTFMNKERGFGLRVLTILEEHNVSWEHMPTGIDTMSIIIKDEALGQLGQTIVKNIEELCHPDAVSLTGGLAMIATVGSGMHHHIGVAARLCTAIAEAGVNLRVIDQGSSEMNIIIGVDESDLKTAVKAIHDTFVDWE
jgi:aspartate kinase